MPAKSKAQQRFMGMVHAAQKGELDNPSSEVEKAADSMSDADAKDYASTKHKGLPNHVKKENMEKQLKEIIRQTYRDSLRESVNEDATELPQATIPSAVKVKLQMAIDKIKDSKLSNNAKLQLVAQVIDALDVDKSQLSNIANKIRSKMESVNESISHEAMGIASMTNTRKEAVQKFIDDNNLNAKEILTHVTKGKLPERIRFVQALVGTPNNSSFKWYVKTYANESVVNEAIDINHWKKYANGGGPLFSRKVKTQREFNTEFREVAYAYNNDPDSRENRLKRDKIEKVKKLAQEFFDKEGFITSNIIDEMWSAMVSGKIKEGKVNEGAKRFYQLDYPNSKYVIYYYNGKTYYSDGYGGKDDAYVSSGFLNKNQAEKLTKELLKKGYREDDRMRNESVNEGKKAFKINPPIGKAKYSISAHNGVSKHKDGSDFWDILIFKNKADLERRAKYFRGEKYIEEAVVTEGRYDADLDKIEAVVKNATSFMNVGSELKKAGIKYDFTTSMIPMYMIKVSGNTIAICNKKYAAGAEREVNDIAIGLLN